MYRNSAHLCCLRRHLLHLALLLQHIGEHVQNVGGAAASERPVKERVDIAFSSHSSAVTFEPLYLGAHVGKHVQNVGGAAASEQHNKTRIFGGLSK